MQKTNYEKMREKMQERFLIYDQKRMTEKFGLKQDEAYLYIRFVGRDYRIDRKTGRTEWSEDGFAECIPADYNEAMSIFDILCESRDGCRLSGRFCSLNRLKGTVQSAAGGPGDIFQDTSRYFDGRTELLRRACEALGGTKEPVGDVSYRLYPFACLPMMLQFWQSDDEFPAQLKVMWDENVMDFVHYETTFFIVGHVFRRLRELMEKMEQEPPERTETT